MPPQNRRANAGKPPVAEATEPEAPAVDAATAPADTDVAETTDAEGAPPETDATELVDVEATTDVACDDVDPDQAEEKVPAEGATGDDGPTLTGESAHDAAVASWRRNNPEADLEE